MPWLIPVVLFVGAGVTGALSYAIAYMRSSKAQDAITDGKGKKAIPVAKAARRRKLRTALGVAVLPDAWVRFFEITAKRESNFSPTAHNSRAAEVAASKALNKRNGTVGGINFDTPQWGFGSKGLFQFLGANVAIRKGKLRFSASVTEPDMAYDPGIAIAAALSFARGLMGWKQFAGTWASLNIGWDSPGKMGDPTRLANSAAWLNKAGLELGWPEGWADEKIPALPHRGTAALGSLAKAAAQAYRWAA